MKQAALVTWITMTTKLSTPTNKHLVCVPYQMKTVFFLRKAAVAQVQVMRPYTEKSFVDHKPQDLHKHLPHWTKNMCRSCYQVVTTIASVCNRPPRALLSATPATHAAWCVDKTTKENDMYFKQDPIHWKSNWKHLCFSRARNNFPFPRLWLWTILHLHNAFKEG